MAAPPYYSKRRRRVLVVDDDPATSDWMREVLDAEGFESRCALVGTRGHEIYRQWGPDVAVVNLSLPDVAKPSSLKSKESIPWDDQYQRLRSSSYSTVPSSIKSSTALAPARSSAERSVPK